MRTTLIILSMLVTQIACHQNAHEQKLDTQEADRSVGERIPYDVAEQWIKNYQEYSTGRANEKYSIAKEQLQATLQSIGSENGVVLHHASDEAGVHHILFMAVPDKYSVWNSGAAIVDCNTNSIISLQQAQAWSTAYANDHADGPLYHFFGINTINEFAADQSFAYADILPAINDEGKPQLLIMAWNNSGMEEGRIKYDQGGVFDKSSPCPPCGN